MRCHKLVLYHIITMVTMASVYLIYFWGGSPGFANGNENLGILFSSYGAIFVLMFTLMLVSCSFVATRALHKKNLLRVSLIIMSIMFLTSLWRRFVEFWYYGDICWVCFSNTFLYLGLMIIIITILRDLLELCRTLFSREKKEKN